METSLALASACAARDIPTSAGSDAREVAVFDVADRLVAVAMYDPARRLLRPQKVLGSY